MVCACLFLVVAVCYCAWLCDFLLFLLLLSLCVDVLLVCAEGYTQVTGVMAMMMTGRVLLVCALCVLWCVTVFGDARDNRCIEGDGNVLTHTHNAGNEGLRLKADFGLISARIGLMKVVEAEEGGEEELESVGRASPGSLLAVTEDNEAPGPKEGKGAAVAATPPSPPGPGVPGTGDEKGQLPAAGQKGNEKNTWIPAAKSQRSPKTEPTINCPLHLAALPLVLVKILFDGYE
ncbi:mucin-associated surface protein (MASP), putative [Trypanosoma cruzi]|nr:mucin-associated surface protein (MASP), putative [Trypanosoma cruzi]